MYRVTSTDSRIFLGSCALWLCAALGVACSSTKDEGPEIVLGRGGQTGAPSGGQTSGGQIGTPSSGGAKSTYQEPVESIDLNEIPTDVPTLKLEVDAAALAQLEANPFDAEDVRGTVTDGTGARYENIQVNYRGAYQLQNLIRSEGTQRNWKLKFEKTQMYRGRREWNFNYEPHVRQELAYNLMKFAGVKAPSARHVLLVVNGRTEGLYLEYEDPDNKDFLRDKFGDNDGDLYKAATDLPGQTPYFGTTEFLGDTDQSYFLHYQKKTNNDLLPEDYSRLRVFLKGLNSTSEEALPAWVQQNFDADKFVRYLVVANFISGWDGLPQRPKNYWLYEIPSAARWVFIPWDIDATFQTRTTRLNPMGTNASIFYQLDRFESYQVSMNEGQERPLVRRLLKIPALRSAYLQTYKAALTSFLERGYLLDRVSKLENLLKSQASAQDLEELEDSTADVRAFIEARFSNVSAQLAKQ